MYFYDSGLACSLVGIDNAVLYNSGPMCGSIFENDIVAEIMKKELHKKTDAELYYLRTSNGFEVDLIVDRKNFKEFIEIKNSATFKPKMIEAVEQFMDKNDKGFLLYNGKEFPYLKNVSIIPYQNYLD